MFTITVKGKTHKVEKVTPRVLYEMQPALIMYDRINKVTQAALKGEAAESSAEDIKQAMNVLLDWFVVFCGNKFTRDDLLDGYPADTIMKDIGVAIRSVQMGVTEAITAFPTIARLQKRRIPETVRKSDTAVSLWAYTQTAWRRAFRRR